MAELLLPGSDQPVMEVPHSFADAVPRTTSVIVHPHPFYTYAKPIVVPEGITLAEIVAASGIPATYHGFLRVFVDDLEIPRAQWSRVRPKIGRHVYVRATPQGGGGGGGKNILASLLMLVVTVGAAIFAPMIAGALFPTLGTVGMKIATGLIGAGLSMIGALAIRALIPPPQQNDGLASQRALLSGVRNQFTPYADIPRHYGKRRVYPLQAAHPYTEAQGKKRFLRVLLAVGFGPLKISNIKIGETPIENYSLVTYEVREGWHADHAQFGAFPAGKGPEGPQTIFTNSVNEESFSVLLDDAGEGVEAPGPWYSRTTDEGVSEISVDVNLPYGFAKFTDEGGVEELTIYVDVQYRKVGDTAWTSVVWDGKDADDGTSSNGQIEIRDSSRSPTSCGGRWKVPEVGQYEVRLRRRTPRKTPERKYAQRVEWSVMRSIKPQNPLNISGLSVIALRMQATDQLNGLPDSINCEVESYLPTYDGSSWTWALSRSPAWAYADTMRRRGTERMIADARIDLPTIKDWATACAVTAPNAAEPYWTFNGTFERGAVFTALKQIAAHGRSSFVIRDGRYSVVRDVAQTVPVQHITPRNSFGYSGQKGFVDLPHGLKVQFVNADRGFQEDEVIVYADDYSEANATKFETLDLPGCTSATQAWREGRYYLAVGRLRPEEHSVTMDVEHLRCTMGDLVRLSHDVLSIGLASGRIAEVDIGRNVYRNTVFAGAAVGTPGTAPTGWSIGFGTGSITAVTADAEFDGNSVTLSATAARQFLHQQFSPAAGTTWMLSADVVLSQITQLDQIAVFAAQPADATQTFYLNGVRVSNLTQVPVGAHTVAVKIILTATAGTNVQARVGIGTAGAATGVVKVANPQLEAGGVVTDYQPNRTNGSIIGLACALRLDNEVPREVGESYVLRARLQDGTSALYTLAAKTGSPDTSTRVELSPPVSVAAAPEAGDLFIYGLSAQESAPMLVKKIEPGPDMTAKLTLVDAQDGVWAADTGPIPAFNSYITNTTPIPQQQPALPTFSLLSDETVIERLADGTLQDRIAVAISALPSSSVPATDYEVQFKRSLAGEWQQALVSKVSVRQVFIAPVVQGESYDVRVRTISAYGITSDWVTQTGHVVIGKTTVPTNVSGFTVESRVDGVQLSWNPNPEIDVVAYTIKRGEDWDSATLVTDKATGTSLFVGLTVSGEQRFLIRAVDAIGLMSPAAVSVTAAVAAPDDVPFFEAYPQDDSVRFTWNPVAGAGVVYEIRNGDSWATGRFVTRAAGTGITVMWPIRDNGSPIFFIKAVSTAGIYSMNANSASTAQQNIVNRNTILDLDFSADTWAGTLINCAPVGTGAGSTLDVGKAGDTLTYPSAEYFRPISLPDKYYARNWVETLAVLSVGSGLTWADASFTWASAAEASWAGQVADSAGASLKAYLAIEDATYPAPADLVEAFPLDGSLTGSDGTTADVATSISFSPMHYGQGLDAITGAKAGWPLAVPSDFAFLIDFRVKADASDFSRFLLGIPYDPLVDGSDPIAGWGDFAIAWLAGSGVDMVLRFDVATRDFLLTATGQDTIRLPVPMEVGDLITFGIAQTATTRTLMAYNRRTGLVYSATANLAALGAFTALRLYYTATRTAPGALGMVEVRNAAMTLETFSALAPARAPAGYQPFKELIPGDFDYQNAIFRLSISNEDRTLNVSVAPTKLFVDVPDIVNRGTVSVSGSGSTITYPAPYKVAPHLQATQTGGATLALIRITGASTAGFIVQLFDAANPTTPVAGTISYAAIGY